MLGKLLKYDLRSMKKEFALFWPACIVMGLILRFTIPYSDAEHVVESGHTTVYISGFVSGILGLVFFALLVAMVVVSLLFVIQRFYKGLLGDEGYLMNTLPVKPWQLVASKLITAMVVGIVGMAVGMISILVLMPVSFRDMFGSIISVSGQILDQMGVNYVLLALEVILLCLVGMASAILELYLAMALGHLFRRNRLLGSFLAFLGISVVLSILSNLFIVFLAATDLEGILVDLLRIQSRVVLGHLTMWVLIIGSAVMSAVFFFITTYILKHRLNLE